MRNLEARRRSENRMDVPQASDEEPQARRSRKLRASWVDRSGSRSRSHSHADAEPTSDSQPRSQSHEKRLHSNTFTALTSIIRSGLDNTARPIRDIEAQITPETYLFTDTQDALEDIEPEARQKIIKRAFQHPATRAIQPAVWIPHDELGLTADEIQRTGRFTNNIWITSKNARLDAKCHVMFKGLPPDWDPFDNMDI